MNPNVSLPKTGMSLSFKTVVAVVMATTLLLSLFGWYRYLEWSEHMNFHLNMALENAADRLEINLKDPLYDLDKEKVLAVISAEMKSKEIEGIYISDHLGMQSGFVRNETGEIAAADKIVSEENLLTAEKKITGGDVELGNVKIFMTKRFLEQDMRRILSIIVGEVMVLNIILVIVLNLFIRKIMIIPMNSLANLVRNVSEGDFSQSLDEDRADRNFRDEIQQMRKNIVDMKNRIREVLGKTGRLIQAVREGRLETRASAEEYSGGWRDLLTGVNEMMDAFTVPFHVTADCIDRIAKGSVPEKIAQTCHGDFNEIRENLNLLIQATDHITRVAEEIGQGNMMVQAPVRSENDRLMKAMNAMICGFQGTVRVAEKIARGDLTVSVTILSEKDVLGKSLRQMVDKLAEFASEARKMAEQVTTASAQISAAVGQISEGAVNQSTAIDQISASMEEMSSAITHNADNAAQTAAIAAKAAEDAGEGEKVLKDRLCLP